MLDLKTQCPELLQQLPGFPSDGTGTALGSILKVIHANQSTLRKKLGMSDDQTTLDQPVECNLESSFPVTKNLITSLLADEDKDTADVFNNRLSSGMKITRAITRRVAAGEHLRGFITALGDINVGSSEDLKRELPKMPATSGLDLLKDPMTFVQNFYSEVAAVKGKSIGFTIDPLMFIRGCNSPNYSSCYTIRKEYNSAAPITLGLSGYAAMIYSRDSNTILGRCWVIFAPDFKSFNVLKEYGFLSSEVIDTVCGWISTLLAPDKTWFKITRPSLELNVSHLEQGVYCDPIRRVYSYDQRPDGVVCSNYLNITTSKCIICGNLHGSSRIICDTCHSRYITRCNKCGSIMIRDSKHTFQLCPSCLKTKVICPDCGVIHDADKECSCKKNNLQCSFCKDKSIMSYSGVHMCASCAEIIHTKTSCEVCGAEGLMYPYNKHSLCQTCFSYVTIDNSDIPSDKPTREKLIAIIEEDK